VKFRVLGPLEATDDGHIVDLGAPQQKAVLAYLLLHANAVIAVDRLAEAIWAGDVPRTAAKSIQVHVSALRKALGPARDMIETRPPGYLIRIGPGELDLYEFEHLVSRARTENPSARLATLDDALSLWRGPPLADFAYESFAQPEAARLEELRQHVREERIEVALELGAGSELISELQTLVAERPLLERPRSLLMRALYRAGRQSDALAVFREGAQLLDDELGLEPGPDLRELERSILRHDPALGATAPISEQRAIVAVEETDAAAELVRPLAGALACRPSARELVLVRIVSPSELQEATASLTGARGELADDGAVVRVAAFSSTTPGADVVRLAGQRETDLVLLTTTGDPLDGPYASVFERATSDVAAFVISGGSVGTGPVVVPFGAFTNDWAALELGAWAAVALGLPLHLIGAAESDGRGRDASRLLADASLIVQHTTGVVAEPRLGPPGGGGIAQLAKGAGLLVLGLSERWRSEGLGATRATLVGSSPAPLLLVRRGLRPSGIAPSATLTRFTWSIELPRG
jgi:DNA-binding SARP family transcriptional activator